MADPLSIFGAAAAATQLVAACLLKSIQLAKDLKDVPQKMALALHDAERSTTRVHYICGVVLQPGSNVFAQLDQAMLGGLVNITTELRQAMDEVLSTLQPLVDANHSRRKPVQRLWRSIMSLVNEKDVEEKLHRIDRLNLEAVQQLDITGLDLQATSISKIELSTSVTRAGHAQLLDTVQAQHRDLSATIHGQHATTATLLSSISTTSSNTQTTLDGLRENATEMATGISSITEGLTVVREGLSSLQASTHAGQSISPQQMQHLMSQQMQHLMSQQGQEIRAGMTQLRDELLASITGHDTQLSAESRRTSLVLNETDRRAVQQQTQLQLMRYPSSLVEASRALPNWNGPIGKPCRCRTSRKVRETVAWRLSFRIEKSADHRPECPYTRSGYRTTAFSVRTALAPFINGTVELAVGATTGPGGWFMAPPLRFAGTVQRSKSPLFQAFVQTAARCADVKSVDWMPGQVWFQGYEVVMDLFPEASSMGWHLYTVKWDPTSTKSQLIELRTRILEEVTCGRASGSDTDESGETILFYFVKLFSLMGVQWREFAVELEALLGTLLELGVDPNARALGYGDTGADHRRTALEVLFTRPIFGWAPDTSRQYYQPLILDCLDRSSAGRAFEGEEHIQRRYNSSRYFQRVMLQRYPDVAEGVGYDDFEIAILRRSIADVERLAALEQNKPPNFDLGPKGGKLGHLELALGWDLGLRYLVLVNHPVSVFVLRQIWDLQDLHSLSIVLQTPRPIFSTNRFRYESILSCFAGSGDLAMFRLVLDELKRRRSALRELAMRRLTLEKQRQLGIFDESVLDANAKSTYECLSLVMEVPESLKCWPSPYHYIPWNSTTTYWDAIVEAGFKAVDIPDENGYTPLFYFLGRRIKGESRWQLTLKWFLSRGALPMVDAARCEDGAWPTVLFYVALWLEVYSSAEGFTQQWALETYNEVSRFIPHQVHSVSDGCVCFCSNGGCLPSHRLRVYCAVYKRDSCECKTSDKNIDRHCLLRVWATGWKLDDLQKELLYAESARIDAFERLGMAHTCCRSGPSSDRRSFQRHTMDDEERTRLREEDGELVEQLNSLMAEYEKGNAAHEGPIESFWHVWRQTVDQILPPVLLIEACRKHGGRPEVVQRRVTREREALEAAGYVGPEFEDFSEVIRVHFSGRDWNSPVSLEEDDELEDTDSAYSLSDSSDDDYYEEEETSEDR